jgi:hypothetical protein
VHVSELELNIFDAIKFLSSAWNDIKPETIQKCFKNCGFSKNTDIAKYDLNEIENQVNELAEIAENIGIQGKNLIFEEIIPEFEMPAVEDLRDAIIEEFYDDYPIEEDDVIEPENVEINNNINGILISNDEAINCLTKLITYAKEKHMYEGELNLLKMKQDVISQQKKNLKQNQLQIFL